MPRWLRRGWWRVSLLALSLLLRASPVIAADDSAACAQRAGPACLQSFDLPGGAGRMHYYLSRSPDVSMGPTPQAALVILHGHPRDANRSFEAGLQAVRRADRAADTVVAAPIYQVPSDRAGRCSFPGVPTAEPGDAVWTCSGWLAGGLSLGAHPLGAFAALDALIVELVRQWPGLRTVTLVGFSAGAQMLQHGVGFAADPPAGIDLRYVIADPGSWLYLDPVRPRLTRAGQAVDWSDCGDGEDLSDLQGGCSISFEVPADARSCPGYDDWKYGVQSLPAALGRSAAAVRARHASARIDYLQGAGDSRAGKGTAYSILDRSCAATLQGPFRLQRGVAYAAYEQAILKPLRPRRLVVVPGCAHDVSCVIPSPAAAPVLFDPASSPSPSPSPSTPRPTSLPRPTP